MNHLFISYSRTDATWVDQLADELRRRGHEVWIDQRDLPFSLKWVDQISDAVDEACLFLICDSPRWRASEACRKEFAIATSAAKRSLAVEVGSPIEEAAQVVSRARESLPSADLARTELLVRARDWDRTDRPRNALLSTRGTLRFRYWGRSGAFRLTSVQSSYVAASIRRARQRAVLLGAALVVLAVAAFATLVFVSGKTFFDVGTARDAGKDLRAMVALEKGYDDPYAGLERAAAVTGGNADTDAVVIQAALESPVPDDAFSVPKDATSFGETFVGESVIVVTREGDRWSRRADASDVRAASPTGTASVAAEPGAATARPVAASGWVEIQIDGQMYRRIGLGGPVTLARLSAERRWLAGNVGSEIHVADVETGVMKLVLRGGPGEALDIAWSADGQRIWALYPGWVLSWTMTSGRTVLNEPDQWFQAVFAEDEKSAWVVDREGRFRLVDLQTSEVLRSFDVGSTVYAAVVDHRGRLVHVTGPDDQLLVDLTDGSVVERFHNDCSPVDADFGLDDTTVLVACDTGDLVLEDVDGGDVVATADVPGLGASALRIDPSDGTVYLGGRDGTVWRLADDGSFTTELHTLLCRQQIESLSVAENGAILPVGIGSGRAGCSTVGTGSGARDWNSWYSDTPDASLAIAGCFLAEGRAFAVGLSDGSIVIMPTSQLLPATIIRTVSGAVRSMYYDDETGRLVAATRQGQLVSIPVDPTQLDNAGLAAEAARRMTRAIEVHAVSSPGG